MLFNGQDLSGWYGWNPHSSAKLTGEAKANNLKQQRAEFSKHWTVENGELVNNGTGPYATTEEEFGDIELLIEYQTVAKADSGIYLRGTPQIRWDVNQKFDLKNPNRKPHQGSGGLFNNAPQTLGRDPIMVADKPFGQWNTLHSANRGPHVGDSQQSFGCRRGRDGELLGSPAAATGQRSHHAADPRWRNWVTQCLCEIDAAESKKMLANENPLPNPTHYDVAYGPHPKQVLHFWQAKSSNSTPVLYFIHGGGWMNGGRLSGLSNILPTLLDSGISVASVEYRFIPEATADGVVPPVKGPLHDAAWIAICS